MVLSMAQKIICDSIVALSNFCSRSGTANVSQLMGYCGWPFDAFGIMKLLLGYHGVGDENERSQFRVE